MPDSTPQQHADAIKAAAQAYYDAVATAEGDGLTVHVDAKRSQEIGQHTPRYHLIVEVEAKPDRWRAA